ncbi:hypothetical protein GCM10022199_21800 [Marihabitans asiaticum]|uniref:Uncharacterized protein n=1 Tax=Marihabitans asiaticum TaxID=415218 RepID=A0A560WAE0_9MICO|nr:hypothetical protein [Marihabitans asiaticum]TWD14594.1 hypothetical protein FB557_2008 [Marihabitans asiaticum]
MSVSEGMDVERVRASERAVLGQVRAIEVSRLETRRSAARLAQAWQGRTPRASSAETCPEGQASGRVVLRRIAS